MRRASFVAPLLLIGIGVLFLLRNIYPEIRLGDYVGRFWPWILIAWGALRLIELVIWRSQQKSLPAHGVSGGEWVLVLFLCLFGAGLHTAQGFVAGWPGNFRINGADLFGEPFEYPVEAQKESSRAPHILVEAFRGTVRVVGTDAGTPNAPAGIGMVKVTGNKTVRSMDRAEAENLARGAGIEMTGDPNDLVIRPSRPSIFDSRSVSFNIEISVPKGALVEVRGQDGELNVEDLAGVVLSSDRSDVHLRNISGHAQLSSRRGDVHVDAAAVPGQIGISSGDISANDVTGPLKISGKSGDVVISRVNGAIDVDMTRGDLSLRLGQVSGPIHAQVRSGDISLLVPGAARFNLDASTSNGDVASAFSELKTEASGHRGNLRGSVGNGPVIELRTGHGDVSVTKSGAVFEGESKPDRSNFPPATELQKLEQ